MGSGQRRYLIDASMAQGGGGFTYGVNLIPELVRLAPDDRFRVLVRSPQLADALPSEPNLEITRLPPVGLYGRFQFLVAGAPREASAWGADLYFSVSETAPPRLPCPSIASFRNAAVVDRKRHRWPAHQRVRLRILFGLARLAAMRCDRILFVSEDSASWMGDALRVPPANRVVIHHGIHLAGWQQPVDHAAHGRPYILSVGSNYRYKNYVRLIEAYELLAHRVAAVPDLLIIGDIQDRPYLERMERARLATGDLAKRIHILGEVPYAAVRGYFARATLFVFPSYLETFGHPLLEAMASGLPVVASDIPVFHEIADDAALYADPYDSDALATAMARALDSRIRAELMERAGKRVQEFSWARSAERHLELFEQV